MTQQERVDAVSTRLSQAVALIEEAAVLAKGLDSEWLEEEGS